MMSKKIQKVLHETFNDVKERIINLVDDDNNEEDIKISEEDIVISKSFDDEEMLTNECMGWQIGAVLVGSSALIVAIYLAKTLNSINKVVEKAYKIVDYNERHIQDIVENASSISKGIDDIVYVINKILSIGNIFKIIKRK